MARLSMCDIASGFNFQIGHFLHLNREERENVTLRYIPYLFVLILYHIFFINLRGRLIHEGATNTPGCVKSSKKVIMIFCGMMAKMRKKVTMKQVNSTFHLHGTLMRTCLHNIGMNCLVTAQMRVTLMGIRSYVWFFNK